MPRTAAVQELESPNAQVMETSQVYPIDETESMRDEIRSLDPEARRALSQIVRLLWDRRQMGYSNTN